MMLELYLMRHGRTVWNEAGRIQGSTDVQLAGEGRELARRVGAAWEAAGLHFDAVCSSPKIRAYETACLAAGYTGLPILRDERLREVSFGNLEGREIACLMDTRVDPLHGCLFDRPELYVTPEGGESLEEVTARGADFLAELYASYPPGSRILIVAHGAMNKALLRAIKKTPVAQFWEGKLQKNCAVTIIRTDGTSFEMVEEGKSFA